MILMCKNVPVYDIDKDKILNEQLIPGSMLGGMSYANWSRHRKSVISNKISRKLYFKAFGYESDCMEESKTHMLSLSDCFWKKGDNEDVSFEDITPYCNDFWSGDGEYVGGAVPSIYVAGVVDKYWISKDVLYKEGCKVELEAYKLAMQLGVSCSKIEESDSGIAVHNITNMDVMLEPAICSGRFSGTFFPDVEEVLKNFGDFGIKMMTFDAILGNTDRHLENFGFLRNTDTGEYLKMAPLYDFDHTFEADGVDDYLIKNVVKNDISLNMCRETIDKTDNVIFYKRASAIMKRLENFG